MTKRPGSAPRHHGRTGACRARHRSPIQRPGGRALSNARSAQPCAHLTLSEVYRRIQTGAWAAGVAEVRRCRARLDAATDPAECSAAEQAWQTAKAQLPAVTLSADAHTRSRDVALGERGLIPSGRVQLDFDLHGGPACERDRLRAILVASPPVEALWLSPSGDGLKGTVRVRGAGDLARHAEVFAAVDRWLLATIGRANDPQVKDPPVSYTHLTLPTIYSV